MTLKELEKQGENLKLELEILKIKLELEKERNTVFIYPNGSVTPTYPVYPNTTYIPANYFL